MQPAVRVEEWSSQNTGDLGEKSETSAPMSQNLGHELLRISVWQTHEHAIEATRSPLASRSAALRAKSSPGLGSKT